MESKRNNQFLIDIPNYNGSLEILDLAKTQKVDLADISITKLDNFLDYVKKARI